MPYALCPMPYALCPMPYARRVPHVSEKGYISHHVSQVKSRSTPSRVALEIFVYLYDSPPLLALEKTGATNPTNKAMGTAYPSNIRFLSFKLANMARSPVGLGS